MKSDGTSTTGEGELDARIAAFADRVIGDKSAQGSVIKPVETETEKEIGENMALAEMAELEETILRFNAAAKAARPDPAAAARISAGVRAAWKKPQGLGWAARLNAFNLSQRLPVYLAAVLVVVLLAAGLLMQSGTGELTGAALELPLWTPFLLIVGIIIIFVILRKDRS
jgi:hypothetical protein